MENAVPVSRPKGLVAKWSQTQAMRWIKASVNAGSVRFSYHAEHERGRQRNVSPDEAAEAIVKGKVVRWEPGEIPSTREPTMNMTFEYALTARSISAVASIMDEEPDVVVVTVWEDMNYG